MIEGGIKEFFFTPDLTLLHEQPRQILEAYLDRRLAAVGMRRDAPAFVPSAAAAAQEEGNAGMRRSCSRVSDLDQTGAGWAENVTHRREQGEQAQGAAVPYC